MNDPAEQPQLGNPYRSPQTDDDGPRLPFNFNLPAAVWIALFAAPVVAVVICGVLMVFG